MASETADTAGLVVQLTRLALLVQAAHEHSARDHDVSPTLARLLGLLDVRSPTMNELAALLGLDKSSTSGLVDRAQRRGFVRRVPSQLDRRSVRVRITKQGSALNETLAARFAGEVTAMVEQLPDGERQTLTESLSKILSHR